MTFIHCCSQEYPQRRNRLAQLFGLSVPTEGTWFEIKLEREPFRPRAWQLPLANNYVQQAPTNATAFTQLFELSAIVSRLKQVCVAPDAVAFDELKLRNILRSIRSENNLEVTVIDVGQAACVAFSSGDRPFGYFDVGAPNTARFQKGLGRQLSFIAGDLSVGRSLLQRCTGTDRNSTGYALRINRQDAAIMLPGDADYRWIPQVITQKADRIMISHHGAAGSAPPPPNGGGSPVAIASYGIPNSYRHPNESQIAAHRRAGWRVRRTATYGNTRPRGNRRLYP